MPFENGMQSASRALLLCFLFAAAKNSQTATVIHCKMLECKQSLYDQSVALIIAARRLWFDTGLGFAVGGVWKNFKKL